MKGTSCDIDTLYDRYSRRLFHTALRIVGDAMEAEEAMQDAFLKFARMRPCPQDDSAGEAAVRVARIKAGLNELPDGCRLILSLCLFEGYDYAEIAEITGLKTSSVRSQYTRAKGKLLEKLQRDG